MPRPELAHGPRQRLAGRASCSVDRCPCGSLHVNLGSVTLRFDEQEFKELAAALGEAASALARCSDAVAVH